MTSKRNVFPEASQERLLMRSHRQADGCVLSDEAGRGKGIKTCFAKKPFMEERRLRFEPMRRQKGGGSSAKFSCLPKAVNT